MVIKVAAAGVNRADVLQAAGKYPRRRASEIIGMEVSGTITDIGDGVTEWSAGQEVCALLAVVATPSMWPFRRPGATDAPGVSLIDAAARPRSPARCGRTW
ncbi:alcohol dehydrogenase GroES-like domain protein [Mycobacterium ulcerans str. Harvey]|uniref:Alcohol dehydrogenase GroES-like domain protein n=1 Tax=Mycobacterium ulcerans str. Harvey TaxID=1299332 RepID=A0ABN0R8K1_MYCUL|nr:alcohol dehydrogenase GroES-like domain protein [Mycobacterium ulcerans str. Harvey]